MAAADEIFDIVNAQDRVIGRAPRPQVHAQGLRHRAVHVFVFNERGELFVQKRAAGKDTFPGCYDSSCSGHLDSGEDYDAAAVRELGEELGLMVPVPALHKHFKIDACTETGWEFVWVYSLRGRFAPVINPAEIESGGFWPLAAVAALRRDQPDRCAPSFRRIFREFAARKLLPGAG